MKNSDKDARYAYIDDKYDRRADLHDDDNVVDGLKAAVKSDEEHDEKKCGKSSD